MLGHLYSAKKYSWRVPRQFEALNTLVASMDVTAQKTDGAEDETGTTTDDAKITRADSVQALLDAGDSDDNKDGLEEVVPPSEVAEVVCLVSEDEVGTTLL